jgi:hypothetical protein
MEISSEEGRGTQIVVWVPLRDGEEELRR